MLQAWALNFKKVWDKQLALIEFSHNNNNYHFSIGMAPYEALYRRNYRTRLCWQDINESLIIGLDLIYATTEKMGIIQ